MRFLIDAQLPPALATWMGEHGFSATPVRNLGLRDSDDGSIWNVKADDWVVLTKDEDFVDRCMRDPGALPVVWRRIGNCTNRVLLTWLEPVLPEITRRLREGDKIIEIR